MTRVSSVLINGEVSQGTIPVTDSAFLRGDGCFEVVWAYEGVPFEVEGHIDRLERSAARLDIELPAREEIRAWISAVASELGDCAVRVVVTRGSSVAGITGPPLVVVFAHDWERPTGPASLLPVDAPWHSAGAEWELLGAKVVSYAPNQAASRRANREGYDDALLVSKGGLILEGPTFCVAWVVDGTLETPSLDLGILDSITRRRVLEEARGLGIRVVEGAWPLSRLEAAEEMMALSTTREVQPVGRVGDLDLALGPITDKLAHAFSSLVRRNGNHH